MRLTASHILTFDQHNTVYSPGFIDIENDIITAVGPLPDQSDYQGQTINLKSVLLPGFVNAHCHLELTTLGPLPATLNEETQAIDFVPWIWEIMKAKNSIQTQNMEAGIKAGWEQLLKSGVTCIGDHISFNVTLESLIQMPLRGILFGEVLGIVPEMCSDIYEFFKILKKRVEQADNLLTLHISAHAPHTVDSLLLKEIFTNQPAPLSCHVDESFSENEMYSQKRGQLLELIHSRRPDFIPPASSALTYLDSLNVPLEKMLLVHGNYLSAEGIKLVKKNDISIVHCPGSHTYFGHQDFPIEIYLKENINVALGTDSIASNTRLDFLHELKLLRQKKPMLGAEQILSCAIRNGAKALGMSHQIGSLEAGKKADIIGFDYTAGNPYDAPFNADHASLCLINGQVRHQA